MEQRPARRRRRDPASARDLRRGLRSAGRQGLLPAVRPLLGALPQGLAAQVAPGRAGAGFAGLRALGRRSRRAELGGRDPLRLPAPGAHHPRQHGGAPAAADSARAGMGVRLRRQRRDLSGVAGFAVFRARAALFPDHADLVASPFRRRRMAGGAGDGARVRPRRLGQLGGRSRRRPRRRSRSSSRCGRWPTACS